MRQLATYMREPSIDRLRVWPMNHRTNQTLRPSLVDIDTDMEKPILEVADNASTLTLFLEMGDPTNPTEDLPSFDKEQDVMLFFKYYDPRKEKIHFMGHMYVSIAAKVRN